VIRDEPVHYFVLSRFECTLDARRWGLVVGSGKEFNMKSLCGQVLLLGSSNELFTMHDLP